MGAPRKRPRASGPTIPESARRTKRKRPQQPESRTRELGAPVVVPARYPQALLAEIDAARGPLPRQRWLVEAARERLSSLCSVTVVAVGDRYAWRVSNKHGMPVAMDDLTFATSDEALRDGCDFARTAGAVAIAKGDAT